MPLISPPHMPVLLVAPGISVFLGRQGDEWTPLSSFSSFGAVQFTSFEHARGRYVVGAEYDCTANRPDKRGSILYLFTEDRLQLQHVLPGGYPTDVAIWWVAGSSFLG